METNLEHHQREQDLPIEELAQLNLCEDENEEQEEEYDDEDEDDDDVDFSFACEGALLSPVSAEDAFHNGEIRPVFPLFGYDLEDLKDGLPLTPRMKKIFVETNEDVPVTSSAPRNDVIAAGPYCQWSEKTAEKPDLGKKSNSTGFSKLWRFKDFVHRSNSDGRDAFVFLNPPAAPPRTAVSGEVKDKVKVPQKKKKKSESVLAHERYMKSKAKDDARRRYRPDIVGLFTNVNGGLTRNVHPF